MDLVIVLPHFDIQIQDQFVSYWGTAFFVGDFFGGVGGVVW